MKLQDVPGFEMASFEVLPVDKLFIDTYQRNVRQSLVKDIANNFNPGLIGYISVSQRENGLYAIVDGQHRYEGAIEKGYTHLPCMVFGLTKKQEASNFIDFNTKRASMTATQVFWSEVDAEDRTALKILSIVDTHGFFVTKQLKGGKAQNPYEVSAVGALKRIYKNHGETVLHEVLEIVSRIWVDDSRRSVATVLIALCRYINNETSSNNYQRSVLVSALNKTNPPSFLRKIAIYRETFNANADQAGVSVICELCKNSLQIVSKKAL